MVVIIWLAFCVWIGIAANNKGRSGIGWFFLAALLSPLIMGIAVALAKDLKVEEDIDRVKSENQQLKDRVVSNEKLTDYRLGRVESEVTKISDARHGGAISNSGQNLIGDETTTCPACAETIRAAALKCKHCGIMIETMKMKKCRYCAENILESSTFCKHCKSQV